MFIMQRSRSSKVSRLSTTDDVDRISSSFKIFAGGVFMHLTLYQNRIAHTCAPQLAKIFLKKILNPRKMLPQLQQRRQQRLRKLRSEG